MGKNFTRFMVTAGALLAFTGPVRGQEVNSDVKIPPPRELVSGSLELNGSLAQAAVGVLNEGATREELGGFMTSLLVKAGIIAFDRPPAPLATAAGNSERGSWPAWTGRTPMTLSVSRTGRSDSVLRR
jgi:hypothetical protein